MWDDDAGYDYSDPKHPDWADSMADAADDARKRAKEEPPLPDYDGVSGTKRCEDYPCCGHEWGDCDGSKYGSDESIKAAAVERMRMEDEGYFYSEED